LFSIYLLEHIIEGTRQGRIEVRERVGGRKEEDVNLYCMTLRKREYSGN
jgi:hypothetical protein